MYVLGVLLMESFGDILSVGVWVFSILVCVAALFRVAFKKIATARKVMLMSVLSIPVLDITFNVSHLITNKIKGEIVLSAMDDSFATTRSIVVRQKNGQLKAEYDFSVAGLTEKEDADVFIENDSVMVISLKERDYSERLIFDRHKGQIRDNDRHLFYNVVKNEILK